MKYLLVICMFAGCFFLVDCSAKKKVEYDIPSHYGKEARENAIDWFEKGKILYKIDCAGCHGIYKKGKDSIPNFTKTQIDNYHATALIGLDQNNHAVAKKMSSEQIDYVITFLRLRKID